jgi:hypothetical protein
VDETWQDYDPAGKKMATATIAAPHPHPHPHPHPQERNPPRNRSLSRALSRALSHARSATPTVRPRRRNARLDDRALCTCPHYSTPGAICALPPRRTGDARRHRSAG